MRALEPGEQGAESGPRDDRAATQVVGVAVLLGLTVVSLGALTAGIGAVVEENAASADAARVADGMSTALEPVERTGHARAQLSFTGGRLRTVERDLRVLNGTRTVRRLDAGALVWTDDGARVEYVAGAVIRGTPDHADLHAPPPVTASRGAGSDGVLVVGAPRLGADAGRTVTAGTGVPLRTNVSHDRTALGTSRFRVAVETRTPGALAPYFREQGATVSRRDIDDDGVPSVVATYPGQRRAYLVVHDLNLSVGGSSQPSGSTTTPRTPSPTATPTPTPEPEDGGPGWGIPGLPFGDDEADGGNGASDSDETVDTDTGSDPGWGVGLDGLLGTRPVVPADEAASTGPEPGGRS